MKRTVALLALLACPAGLAACTTFLGDFTVGPGGSPDSGAGSDATVDTNMPTVDAPSESADAPGDSPTEASGDSQAPSSDAGDSQAPSSDAGDSGQDTGTSSDASLDGATSDAGDAGADADAGPPTLTCSAFQYGSPIQIVSLQNQPAGSRTLAVPPAVFQAPNADQMFVVLSAQQASFQVYQVSLSRAMAQPLMQTTTHGQLGAWLYTQDGMAVVTADQNAGQTSLVVTDLPTTLTGGSTLPAGVPVWTWSGSYGYFAAAAQELAPGMYDYLYTISPSSNLYELFVGNSTTPTVPPVTVAMGSTRVDNGPAVVHVGSTSYVFEGGNPGGSSAEIWILPDNATSATGPRMIPGQYTPLSIGMGPSASSATRMNVAFADLQIMTNDAGAMTFGAAALHVGSIDVSQANTFGLADIPTNITFPNLLYVPVNGGTHLWQGDNFVLTGTPFGGAAVGGGIGLIWVDATGAMRATTLPNNVLTSDSYVSQVGASLQTGFTIAGLAAFNVVWSDRLSDASGAYDVVYANQLDCH